jgi:2-aminoadipate transaminase
MADAPQAFRLSARAGRTGAQPIAYLMAQAVDNPNLISLAAGLVDARSLPTADAAALSAELFADPASGRAALQYGTTAGLAPLRRALLDHMAALDGVTPADLDASPDDVVVTTGSQQMLFMLTDLLVDPGDIVITPWPSYFVYTGTLQTAGAAVRCVEMDEQGVVPAKLDALLAELASAGQLRRVKIVYLCDYHDNPTGLTLSAERRPIIYEIVRKYSAEHRILLLEDSAYRELTYEGDPPPSIKRCDKGNHYVALLQTFSKPFAPGVKTGYALLPRELVEPIILQKGNHDFGSANVTQHLLLAALREGVYARHVRELRATYVKKRDAMLEALDEHLAGFAPGQTHWTRPGGGLYVWLTLPPELDTGRDGALFSKAIAEGVLYVPGEYCYGPDPTRTLPHNQMRLSFGLPTIDQVRQGVARLARAIKGVG